MKRTMMTLLWVLACCTILVACSPQQSDATLSSPSDATSSSSSGVVEDGNEIGDTNDLDHKRKPEDLPKNADEAPTDKIYATDGSEIYYESSSVGFQASIPDFEGYTADKVKKVLGEPTKTISDESDMEIQLKQGEQKRIVDLFKKEKISQEEARAFYAGATDFSLSDLGNYYIYEYTDKNIILLFSKSNNKLEYISPNPDFVYWR